MNTRRQLLQAATATATGAARAAPLQRHQDVDVIVNRPFDGGALPDVRQRAALL